MYESWQMQMARLDKYRLAFQCPTDTSPPHDLGQVTENSGRLSFPAAEIELTLSSYLALQLWSVEAMGKNHLVFCEIHPRLKGETGSETAQY
jgi:hypothetical protein